MELLFLLFIGMPVALIVLGLLFSPFIAIDRAIREARGRPLPEGQMSPLLAIVFCVVGFFVLLLLFG